MSKSLPNLVSTILSSLVFALMPVVSQAIGLGNIMLHSHLNEPLDADIPITDTKGVEPSDVIVTVADQKAYEEAGLQPIGWLTSIRFQITKSEVGGRPVLKLKTKEVVKDPFVDLLIDVKWPGGQLLREYTLLLDPPKSVIPSSRPIQKKQKISPVIGAQSEKISSREPINSHGMSRQVNTVPGGAYGPICEESLWSIAKSLAHNTHSNVHQAVMAIAEKNPHAFRDGNINYMLSGAVLKLPDKSELESYSVDRSQYYIAMQGQTPYHEPHFAYVKPTAPKPVTTTSNVVVKPQKALKLVAPVQSLETALKVNTDASVKTENQVVLSDRLTLIEEAIDTLKRTNEDMTRKNQSLQDQNHSLEKLLSMKEEEIKKLIDMVKQPNATTTSINSIPDQFAVAISDVPKQSTGLTEPTIAQMTSAKLVEYSVENNVQNVETIVPIKMAPNLVEDQVKPSAIKVDNVAPYSQQQNKAISADETPAKVLPDKIIISDEQEKSNTSWLFMILTMVLGVMVVVLVWLRRQTLMDLAGLLIERLRTFRSKEMLVNATAGDAEEVANYGLQFDLDRAIDAIAAQEKKFKKTSSTGVKLVKDTTDNPFDTKFADVEECIFYERFGQAEKILKEILQQKSDEWLAVYKLLDLYVLTEKYAEFINFYEGLPAELKEMTPRIWSKIESLHEKVVSESVRFESAEKAENETPTSDKDQTLMIEVPAINAPKRVEPKVVENKDYIDLKKNYPLALEGDEVNDEINIEALPTAEVKELPKSTSNTQEIQKAQIALAKAYIDMGEYADAKDILNDLKKEAAGNHLKKIEALLESIS